MDCPCGTGLAYADCCQPIIEGTKSAPTAEALMRARYSAYTQVATEFLLSSIHPDFREDHDEDGVKEWAEQSEWQGLEILSTHDGGEKDEAGAVEFVCEYHYQDEDRSHHEIATFTKEDDKWFFVEGRPAKGEPYVREEPKVGRNDPCTCGSGKKFKKCCGAA